MLELLEISSLGQSQHPLYSSLIFHLLKENILFIHLSCNAILCILPSHFQTFSFVKRVEEGRGQGHRNKLFLAGALSL